MSRPHVTTAPELSTLRDLEIVTRATVEGLRHGVHRSPFHGYSAEFNQYRHYRPGDDLKYVDWKVFARTNRLYTRQFRETTSLAGLLVVDASRSMDYGGKFALARRTAAILGALLIDQGDGAGVLALGSRTRYLPPRSGHRHLTRLLAVLADLVPDGHTPFTDALDLAAARLMRKGLVVAVSDLYDDETALAGLRRLARMGHEVIVVQTLDADELRLAPVGAVSFVDAETGRSVLVQSEAAGPAYARRIDAWLAGVEAAIRREGLDYLRLSTADVLDRALRRFLLARSGD